MPRPCSVCARVDRGAIDEAILSGGPLRRIAAQFGVPATNLRRHAPQHLSAAVAQAQAARERAVGIDVEQQMAAINGASLQVLRDARASGDGRLALLAVDRVLRQIELQAKLRGEIDERPVVNVTFETEWPALRWRLVQSLDAFPDARQAVLSALASADGQVNGRAH
jgi:hypothetical protein